MTIAVAPNGGTEPALLRAYADKLARQKLGVRLKVVAFGRVRGSAEALKTGKADLAVFRPDVSMPGNGLTLAVLRELAAFGGAKRLRGQGRLGPSGQATGHAGKPNRRPDAAA